MTKSLYSNDHKQLVEQLKKARKEVGMDQKDVAKALCKTQSYISKIETGQRRVDVIQLKELARIYKKSVSFFI